MEFIQPVRKENLDEVAHFLRKSDLVYRHLDWHSPTDWLDYPAFLVLRESNRINALLSCAPEIKEAAWVRLFASKLSRNYANDFQSLMCNASEILMDIDVSELACLVLNNWIEPVLIQAGFCSTMAVVTLIWTGLANSRQIYSNPDVFARQMMERDLGIVHKMDNRAFPPLWQNSLSSINKSYHISSYNTIALLNDEVVGYQISTISFDGAHIARLATRTDQKRQGIATTLLIDVITHFQEMGITKISVNTQSNNQASLNLYKKLGFSLIKDEIKVYSKLL